MLNIDTKKHLQEILQKIQQGNVVLFLGAGASHSAGGPTGKKLTEMIKERFPNINQQLSEFIEICQDVLDTPPYNRNELEDFIKSKLDVLKPTSAHKIMTKYDWGAIFTTNFDDLIEFSYRDNSSLRLKPCQPIYSERFHVSPADRSKVYLFKIMGSITATEGESGNMVLSRADYNSSLVRRRKYLELLSDFVKTGTMVFIGYSFGDRIVLDIIDDLIGIYGLHRLPWSYALFDKLKIDQKTQYMLSQRKIIPVECDFENFSDHLDNNYKSSIGKITSKNVYFKIRGYTLEISDTDIRQCAEYFEVLDEEKINQQPGEKDKFFMGTETSWGAFREDWDFKRDIYSSPKFKRHVGEKIFAGCLKDRVFDELKTHNIEDNKVLLVTGMAGVGKTMILKRLAYDVYKSGKAPVIIINTTRTSFDYTLIASFIENLNHEFIKNLPEGHHEPPIKPVILIDDAASLIRHVNRLKSYLTSRARPALIIAFERKGEWDLMEKQFLLRIADENIYELNEQLVVDEKKRIIDHFYTLGYIQTKEGSWDDIFDKTFENSYFATIYTLVHPSRKSLNEIIRDQYQNLTDLTQKAFQYICSFHQFNLPINLELLVRSLNCSYEDYLSEVIGKDAAKVIFEVEDEIGNILYRSHHRIIAKKTVELFFGDPEMLKNIFLEIFRKTNLTNRKETEICEKLLIQHIGPNSTPQIFTHEQQRQIFKVICEKTPIRTFLHHWGVLEADDCHYLEAERLLKRALEIPKNDIESYRGESDQNVLTSLGSLYSRMGVDFIKKRETKEAEEYFKKAEESFQHAKHGEYPNAYAYHSHAHMWYLRGNQTTDTENINYYATALEILSIAKDNLNEEELQQIYELETLIWSQIGDEKRIVLNLEILRNKFNCARGYYLIAQLSCRKAHKMEGKEKKIFSVSALEKIQEGLKYFPNDEHCLRLQSKLIKELETDNLVKYYESLQKWKTAATTPNAWLLYELGRTSFILGYYDFSKGFFKELETGVGMGHKLRSRPRYPILDEKGNKKEFEGTVVNILSSYEGLIRCETLRNLRYQLAFRPIACKFMPSSGDSVRFYIEFNYRGPRAENVRKI